MPPDRNPVCRFVAEPPQGPLPEGRWAATLTRHFLGACDALDEEADDLGEPGDVAFHPDRTWHGRTYIPATTLTSSGYELFGYVSFRAAGDDREPSEFSAVADFTPETAAENPDWQIDLCEEVLAEWRGEDGECADVTLVWGRPLVEGGDTVTAELGELTVDQCALVEDRFTLLAPDGYRGDTLTCKLYDAGGAQIAQESLYEEDDED